MSFEIADEKDLPMDGLSSPVGVPPFVLPAGTLTLPLSRREREQKWASLHTEFGRQIVKIDGMDGKGRVRRQVWRTLWAEFHGAWDKRRL